MCGIIGFKGTGLVTAELVEGLQRMEYRGYDSWGVAVMTKKGIFVEKKVGAIGDGKLEQPPVDALLGIAHTRWATHGGVTKTNAHPHLSKDKRFAVAQNGIVENYLELKSSLQKQGYQFKTSTDTEVIVHLIDAKLKQVKIFAEAVRLAFLELIGRNTIITLDQQTEQIVAIRNGSPLVIGHLPDGGVLLASDTLPLAGKARTVTYLDDQQLVVINDKVSVFAVKTGKPLKLHQQKFDFIEQKIDKAGFDHFMLKEIVEQQYTIKEAVSYSDQELLPLIKALKKARTIYTVGAGTAAFAAGQIARVLRVVAKLPVQELKAYEIDSYLPLMSAKDLLLAVSQSGETADTLDAVGKAQKRGVTIASIVNMIGSTLSRGSQYAYLSRSGPEICVASTKAYTAQLAWGYLLAMTIIGKHKQAQAEIGKVAKKLKGYFTDQTFRQLQKLAIDLAKHEHFFVIGKAQHFYTALEGALKIKEITYKHFEGFSAGELKHGVIALIDQGTPVFGIVGNDQYQADVLSALAEVRARGARTFGITARPNEFFDVHIPAIDGGNLDSITKIIPFQLLSYFLGIQQKNNPDKPRNLAKSVTVK
ncbi:MAG: glutamine--fructose-6-phosphate transaminase (isomerizing) [Candidatus Pacebacteria bacterium RIFOXYB1_FULL_39_46]|nr:MAG: glutamine--fructose-6-phosphate transaminase (isomerizing) [Candidatus Pacebacteria bacterium RIFOXYA1_FULL_38_18]OGJ38472.1 MAG: glutamine--fructose-6-phosphate transaminase (isomerizing) [Candidatus Pacebacteria bacterium RIFOXYB1_FULL_39_46]OGJ40332.1 MAG: glutamine--fructose-6-phosphate transaminase (isomerizing) [Candidatus Pacebacteria bacterium RIFOXYC1_FULL_39_21]OGJ40451.1 MAG: glutamine--fructose-6-phosphate transaminase (isomerizing) [Candidatus Pacebacteria bacterium RIFOXYD1